MPINLENLPNWLKKWYVHFCIIGAGLITWATNLFQYHHSGAQVFFGDDTYAHLQIVANLADGQSHVSLGLPVLFQQSVVTVSHLLHTDPVSTYTQMAILSYPLMVIAVGYAAYSIFKQPAIAIMATFFLAFVSLQPLQTYQDGTIPNIYAIGVIFPIFLIGFGLIRERRYQWWAAILMLLSMITLFLTHHLSTLIALSSLGIAGILSSIWIAFYAPKHQRYFFFIPIVLVILGVLGIVFVLKPSALLLLVQLYVAFHHTYPWITFVNSVGQRAPWTVARYGQELSIIVFELGVAGIFLIWFELRKAKRYRDVLPQLTITTWCLIYWLGSFTSLSGEPDRLARDLALPGSILSAYVIWWMATHLWQKYKPLMVVVFAVILASCIASGIKRFSFATSTPDYLYGTIDQQAYTADAAFGPALGIYSPNYYWSAVAIARGDNPTTLGSAAEVASFLKNGGVCVLQFSYKEVIAGGIIDPRFANPVITGSQYTTQRFEDSKKILWRFCQTSIKPIANVSQNT